MIFKPEKLNIIYLLYPQPYEQFEYCRRKTEIVDNMQYNPDSWSCILEHTFVLALSDTPCAL